MIKLENSQPIINLQSYVCVNPKCINPKYRIMQEGNPHLKQQLCRKWIINKKKLLEADEQLNKNILKKKQEMCHNIKGFDNPIQALDSLKKLQINDWKKQLQKKMNSLKKQLNSSLQEVFKNIKEKYEKSIKMGNIYSQFKQILTTFKGQKANSILFDYIESDNIQSSLIQLKNFKLFNNELIQQTIDKIKLFYEQIERSFYEQEISLLNAKKETKEIDNFYNYMFQPTQNMYGRIQILCSALNAKAPNYQIENQQISLNCILCVHNCCFKITPINKKSIKKHVAAQLISHMFCEHYEILKQVFEIKINKGAIKELNLKKVIEEIQKNYQQIHLIDRQSGINYEKVILSSQNFKQEIEKYPKVYAIDLVTSPKNSKYQYILCETRQNLYINLTILTHQLLKQKKIVIYTKTTFGEALKTFFKTSENLYVISKDS